MSRLSFCSHMESSLDSRALGSLHKRGSLVLARVYGFGDGIFDRAFDFIGDPSFEIFKKSLPMKESKD